MAAIFGRRANLVSRLVLAGVALGGTALLGAAWAWPWTDYATGRDVAPRQPVPFSHEHHVGDLGLDCRYCHGSAESTASAGMPPTETCMTCHAQLWTGAPMLGPVRASLAEHQPIRWVRVYRLPDYVFFDHGAHVAAGVGCESCHGRVDRMPLTRQAASLRMTWCLDCHRDPAPSLRPPEAVFAMGWRRGPDTPSGTTLMHRHHVDPGRLVECSICHR
jgi:hypothetical protein